MRRLKTLAVLSVLVAACSDTSGSSNFNPGGADTVVPVLSGGCDAGSCAAGYACRNSVCALSASLPSSSSCSPHLLAGGTAGPATEPSGCVRPVVASASPMAWVTAFGTHRVGDAVSFNVPANTQSITLVSQATGTITDTITLQGTTLDNVAVPGKVIGPSPSLTTYYDDSASVPADPSGSFIYYSTDSVSTGVMTIPNTTPMLSLASGGLPSGTWQFVVNDFALECVSTPQCSGGKTNDTYDIQVILKPGPALTTGTVDVAFYIVDSSSGITNGSAVNNAAVKRMVQSLTNIYSQVGLCLGQVTFYDVPTWAQQKYATGINADLTGPCDPLDQLFTISKPGNTVNFFLVPSITASGLQPGTQIVGLDGTIPGPSSYGGGVLSGTAVSMADLTAGTCNGAINPGTCGADSVAYVAAHEGGHWLGLYHTSEAPGDQFDPLTDTGTCACESCATDKTHCSDRSGVTSQTEHTMSVSECTQGTPVCSGGENLMFWLAGDGSAGLLTPQQGQVMRANIAVQ